MKEDDYRQILKCYDGEVYKFLDVDGAIKTLENQTLQFSSPFTFNDPFDCSEQMLYISNKQEFIEKYLTNFENGKNYIEEINKFKTEKEFLEHIRQPFKNFTPFKYSCFSKYYDRSESGLLWGHYAQKHKGICLCFKFESYDYPFLFYNVDYYSFLPIFDINREDFVKMFFSKSKIWKYEDEVRALLILSKKEEQYEYRTFPQKTLKKVILGYKTEKETTKELVRIIAEKYDPSKITFERMNLDPETFSLKPVPFQF